MSRWGALQVCCILLVCCCIFVLCGYTRREGGVQMLGGFAASVTGAAQGKAEPRYLICILHVTS